MNVREVAFVIALSAVAVALAAFLLCCVLGGVL